MLHALVIMSTSCHVVLYRFYSGVCVCVCVCVTALIALQKHEGGGGRGNTSTNVRKPFSQTLYIHTYIDANRIIQLHALPLAQIHTQEYTHLSLIHI